jgi:hypothetical protein
MESRSGPSLATVGAERYVDIGPAEKKDLECLV